MNTHDRTEKSREGNQQKVYIKMPQGSRLHYMQTNTQIILQS